ncbi:cytochrome P450 4c3-like isoform X2 [Daktulosphaira vitifoliae]|nr:cytochrome P450 4c3-like isoform X2 [Daktulosphaira vitifoliae]
MLNHLFVYIFDPEEIKEVLNNPEIFKKSKDYVIIKDSIFGNGLFTEQDITLWRKYRKKAVDALKISFVKLFIPIFFEETLILGQILMKKRDVNSYNCEISEAINNATMDIFGRTTIGENFSAQKNSRHVFLENAKVIKNVWSYRIFNPWFISPILFRMSKWKKKHDASTRKIQKFTDDLVTKQNQILDNNLNIKNIEGSHDDEKNHKTLIKFLLENNDMLSYEQIRDNVINAIFAGQDTTSIGIACSLFMLAHHQDVQNKLVEELNEIYSSDDSCKFPSYEDLCKMKYLECIIKETLRLYPPIPYIGREVSKQTKIGKYIIPKGSTVSILPTIVHLNPQLYLDPEKFNPDNFLPDVCHKRHPYSFIPFSGGFRNCAGIKYSMVQMKTIISTLVRFYHFSPSDNCPTPDKLQTAFAGLLIFVDGCYVKIKHRKL